MEKNKIQNVKKKLNISLELFYFRVTFYEFWMTRAILKSKKETSIRLYSSIKHW
jgi:hypothetical protein